MAIPERNDRNDPLTEFSRRPTSRLENEYEIERTSSSSGARWIWMWAVIFAIAVFVWWSGWGRAGNTARNNEPAPAGSHVAETEKEMGSQATSRQARNMSGAGAQVFTAQNKQDYVGKSVDVKDVLVQQKVSSRAVWIGADKPMLAIVSGDGSSTEKGLQPGKVIDAQGTVQKAPSEQDAKQQWAISDEDASRLEQQGAYIEISELSVPVQQNPQ